jgi:fructosamine-3-kinase
MSQQLSEQIEAILGKQPTQIRTLTGGCIGDVYRVDLADGESIVAKVADLGDQGTLDIEGFMLQYLADHSHLPVPKVLHSSATLILMEYIEGDSQFDAPTQRHAAELLADLHSIQPADGLFGFDRNTLIGPLTQPNTLSRNWIDFFRVQRLMYMANVANYAGRLPLPVMMRLDAFLEKLDNWLIEPEHPSLLHGDTWTTNILARNGRITAFLDPAIYFGHPEIELAYTTLFHTFGDPFFERYTEIRPIAPGFFEERRDIYNLYPLLAHVRVFGGGYVGSVDQVLRRFGM